MHSLWPFDECFFFFLKSRKQILWDKWVYWAKRKLGVEVKSVLSVIMQEVTTKLSGSKNARCLILTFLWGKCRKLQSASCWGVVTRRLDRAQNSYIQGGSAGWPVHWCWLGIGWWAELRSSLPGAFPPSVWTVLVIGPILSQGSTREWFFTMSKTNLPLPISTDWPGFSWGAPLPQEVLPPDTRHVLDSQVQRSECAGLKENVPGQVFPRKVVSEPSHTYLPKVGAP